MRLFHVSEEENIQLFEPRLPERVDLDKSVGLVWAIDEARLPNFLTPRDCPMVSFNLLQGFFNENWIKIGTFQKNKSIDLSVWGNIRSNNCVKKVTFSGDRKA